VISLLIIYCSHGWYSLVRAALGGNYVQFGVFELYGDRALVDALDISLKTTLSIPLSGIDI
uniref:Uncharacterized protein n=1 Tax=Aegilops tauschii subsp. strangulata TaxID=200361 RepID=A0A452XFD1_AEGTS